MRTRLLAVAGLAALHLAAFPGLGRSQAPGTDAKKEAVLALSRRIDALIVAKWQGGDVHPTPKSEAGTFYRRIQARCGGAKAVVATARKIAERVYRLLKYGQEYVRQAEQAYEEAYRLRTLKAMARKAEGLGYKLVPATAE